MPKNNNWPEELFGDNRVMDAIKILEDAESKYNLAGTHTSKDKAARVGELAYQLKLVVLVNNLIHK
jgi:hypothetical protein